jgi:hypothetical protein
MEETNRYTERAELITKSIKEYGHDPCITIYDLAKKYDLDPGTISLEVRKKYGKY